MNLSELVKHINDLSDENEPIQEVTGWINDAIARINIELKAKFPYMDYTQPDDKPVFPEVWQRACLVPFGVGRIKQKDSSQFEYTDAYNEFMANLIEMRSKYEVPEEYKDDSIASSHTMDFSKNYYAGRWL